MFKGSVLIHFMDGDIMSIYLQSTLRPPDVRIVYRKIGIYMVHMGDNDMHGVRAGKKQGHKHSPSQLELKALLGSIQGKYS